jgi:hypothetical protein
MNLMFHKQEVLHRKIKREVNGPISDLLEAGWTVHSSVYSENSFGNWQVILRRGEDQISLVKDRSQYAMDGDEHLMKPDFRKSFESLSEFESAVWRLAHSTG